MTEMKNESIFDDLLQYVCMCGPLNLRLVAADKWHQFKDIIEKASTEKNCFEQEEKRKQLENYIL